MISPSRHPLPPIQIAILVALAALVLFTTTRRRDAGRLSQESVRKDKSASPFLSDPDEQVPPPPRRHQHDQQA